MKTMRIAAVVAAFGLAACQQDVASIRPQVAPVAQGTTAASVSAARCPPAGMVMRTSEGREFSFLGNDPTDPEVCLWNVGGVREVSRQLYALIGFDAVTAREHRSGLRQISPFAVGRQASYVVMRNDGAWRYTWRVIGEEDTRTPAGVFRTWIIERIEEGTHGNSFRGEQILYMDKDTGVVVKLNSRIVRGQGGYSVPWEAISLRRN